ncbi:hypothetical protein PMAYCL1PPCAC_32696, partial [Pristionchus mayeri]
GVITHYVVENFFSFPETPEPYPYNCVQYSSFGVLHIELRDFVRTEGTGCFECSHHPRRRFDNNSKDYVENGEPVEVCNDCTIEVHVMFDFNSDPFYDVFNAKAVLKVNASNAQEWKSWTRASTNLKFRKFKVLDRIFNDGAEHKVVVGGPGLRNVPLEKAPTFTYEDKSGLSLGQRWQSKHHLYGIFFLLDVTWTKQTISSKRIC